MALLKSLTVVDGVFLLAVGCLLVGGAVLGSDRGQYGYVVALAGWCLFAGFWLLQSVGYLSDSRVFLGLVSLLTGLLSLYTIRLLVSGMWIARRLTLAFGVMGGLFTPYQFVRPVFEGVVRLVTAHTAFGLRALGFDPVVGPGSVGPETSIFFPSQPVVAFDVVSACTGLSAIAMFTGLLVVTRAPWKRRLLAIVAVSIVVYLLNVLRTTVVLGSVAGAWFAPVEPLVGPLYGVADPALVSFYVAEYVLAQVAVVVALLGVYAALRRLLPDLATLVESLVDAIEADVRLLTSE